MGTALYTGVSGLRVHQSRLDVVANNIANVNTPGYRSSRMLFQDLFSQTLQGAVAPSGNFGGSNAIQIGLGVAFGSVDINHTQGTLLTTGVATDLAVQGTGFFVLSDGGSQYYTRDGSFTLNTIGQLIDPSTGMRVQGYMADENGQVGPNIPLTDIVIPVGATSIVRATTTATMIGNLNSEALIGDTVTRVVRIFDSLGTPRDVSLTLTKGDVVNSGGTDYSAWTWEASYTNSDDPPLTNVVGSGVVLFDSEGGFVDEGTVAGGVFTSRAGAPQVSIDAAALGGVVTLPVVPIEFTLDYSAISELADETDVTLQSQDGFPRGTLESFSIGRDGTINGVFTNGLTRTIGQVALSTFSNLGGLEREGNNLFRATLGSGEPQIGTANTGGRGLISGGVLEGSNVDLGQEFSDLILTQRGYQANARTITAADTLLQEAVNLVR